ncbi:MAG: hypothetical protein AB7N54_19445 [Alphaproteobacteria bacterium]
MGFACASDATGPDGTLCPYVEHAPATVEGWEAWDVAERCAGQLRIALSGHVLGLDLAVAFAVGAALGCDARWLAEFLPEIEAGMVDGMRHRDEGPPRGAHLPK